jgi:hypothetical protein
MVVVVIAEGVEGVATGGKLMRASALLLLSVGIAACTSAPQAPNNAIFYEVVPPAPAPVAAEPPARDDFTGRIEQALAEPADAPQPVTLAPTATVAAPPAPSPIGLVEPLPPLEAPAAGSAAAAAAVAAASNAGTGGPVPTGAAATPLDDDRLNLNLYTLEQQRIDAAIAERDLEEARRQLVIVEPGAVPRPVEGVNIALFAQQTSNAVGARVYQRSAGFGGGNCRRFSTPDQAQRVFLSSGGPSRDPYNLDPDGDGFACGWDPEPFRRLAR